MNQHKCIYCLQEKEESMFNREHVIPRMMGTYDGTGYVLGDHQVCQECNSFFSNNIESPVGLDSLEGYLRVQRSTRVISDGHAIGRNRLKFIGTHGLMKGLRFFVSSDRQFSERVHLEIEPVVGIKKNEQNNEYDYFKLEELCNCTDEIRDRIREMSNPIIFFGYEEPDVCRALQEKGYDMNHMRFTQDMDIQNVNGDIQLGVTIHAQVDGILKRLALKTIFNFLCIAYGKEYILQAEFDSLRKYIRYGILPHGHKMTMSTKGLAGIPGNVSNSHVVGTMWTAIDHTIYLCGFVSWFGEITYTVALMQWPTYMINELPKNRIAICDNVQRSIASIECVAYVDWPESEVKLKVWGEEERYMEK